MAGLYVHVPFCARACPYCDFDFVAGRVPRTDELLAGLERERLARGAGPEGHVREARPAQDRPGGAGEGAHRDVPGDMSGGAGPEGQVARDRLPLLRPPAAWPGGGFATVYVGGGTPSLLGPAGLERLGRWLAAAFPGAGAREYTVEVNPEHGDAAVFAAVRAIGGTRVSLGVQTLAPAGLRALGRVHAPAQGPAAIERARAAGLAVSADLIVGWPGQTAAELAADVAGLVVSVADHVSIYALTVEAGTPWEALVRRGRRALPDADHQADMLLAAEAALTAAGLAHYEVASYAAPGREAVHNLGYWSWQDYLGLGPSAHSAVYAPDGAVLRRGNPRGLDAWLRDPAGGEAERLGPREAAAEGLWTGLRHLPGVDLPAYLARFPAVDRAWVLARARRQVARGNLELVGDRLRVAAGRWLWHDDVTADLLG